MNIYNMYEKITPFWLVESSAVQIIVTTVPITCTHCSSRLWLAERQC